MAILGSPAMQRESNPNAVVHEAIGTSFLLHPYPSCPCSPPLTTLDIQSAFVSLDWRRRDWKEKIVEVLLCQVLSPYSTLLELFSQRRWLLLLLLLSLHLRDALMNHLCPTSSPSPCLLKRRAEVTWKKRWRVWSSRTWVVCRMLHPFSTRRSLMDSGYAQNFPTSFFNQRILSSGGSASTWTRWSGPAQVMLKLKYRAMFQCQWKIVSFVPDHLLRWTPTIHVFLSRRPRGQCVLHQEVLGSYFVNKQYFPMLLCLALSACSWTMQLMLSCLFFLPRYGLLHLIYKNTLRPYNYLDRGLQL